MPLGARAAAWKTCESEAGSAAPDARLQRLLSAAQDFLDEHYDLPRISMVNNIIHNNEGYGVVLVKPTIFSDLQESAPSGAEGGPRRLASGRGQVGPAAAPHWQRLRVTGTSAGPLRTPLGFV